ncbi:MAG: FHA domain-containing protein, partial [Myxococcota bacterium]
LPLNLPTTSPTQNNTNPLSSPSQSSPIPPQSSPTPPQDPQHIPLYADSVDMHENSTGPQISLRMTTSTPTFEPHPHAPIPSTFDHPLQSPPSSFTQPNIQDIPPTGTLCLIIYFQRKPALYFPIAYDEVLIGRTDPASNAYPDLDLTPFDPDLAISRKHTYIYREQDRYYIYPISNSGTQVNQEMVDIGTKRQLVEGDVLILSGRLAIRFART